MVTASASVSHSSSLVAVLLKVYATCPDGQDGVARRRVQEGSANTAELRHVFGTATPRWGRIAPDTVRQREARSATWGFQVADRASLLPPV
jgi:hypothetical protein